MKLLQALLKFVEKWDSVFPQHRTRQRARAMAFGILCGVGKRTITRAIGFHGNTQKDWSADYLAEFFPDDSGALGNGPRGEEAGIEGLRR